MRLSTLNFSRILRPISTCVPCTSWSTALPISCKRAPVRAIATSACRASIPAICAISIECVARSGRSSYGSEVVLSDVNLGSSPITRLQTRYSRPSLRSPRLQHVFFYRFFYFCRLNATIGDEFLESNPLSRDGGDQKKKGLSPSGASSIMTSTPVARSKAFMFTLLPDNFSFHVL